ncbi:hypothetical protein OfM1_00810 [Lactovum odontotermitis]
MVLEWENGKMINTFYIGLYILLEISIIICGIQLWRGKWLKLFWKYRHMNEEEKRKSNAKFTARVVALQLFLLAILLTVGVLFPRTAIVCTVLTALTAPVVIVYTKKKARENREK